MAMATSASASVPASFPARRPGAASSARPRGAGAAAEGGKWWAPLAGWSGKADYLEAPSPAQGGDAAAAARRRFVGGLTEEKARELRARTAQTESFHDAMYHSAIASRLARSSA
ncbi:hypothetical protein BS78_09G069300 [Paspalum vaginatum]|nr:hypothetical protein BS78_09G069300 [Paspalum vaginatum]